MTDPTEDSRVRVVAANAILDRGLGKPKDGPPADDEQRETYDFSHMTSAGLEKLEAAIATIHRLTGRAVASVPAVRIYIPDNGRGGNWAGP